MQEEVRGRMDRCPHELWHPEENNSSSVEERVDDSGVGSEADRIAKQ